MRHGRYRVGKDQIPAIHMMENHDEAYYRWHEAQFKDRIVVHIDAHHDLYGDWSTSTQREINIANYLYPTLEKSLAREIVWIVPDETVATTRGRNDIIRALQVIADEDGQRKSLMSQVGNKLIRGTALGKPLTVCALSEMPAISEPVLLDIDIDYMIIPNIAYRGIQEYGLTPWCWPNDLVRGLTARGLCTDFVTIAYSVEGGYTPLLWKYLGDELAFRLQQTSASGRLLQAAALIRRAMDARVRGDDTAAIEHYTEAIRVWPESAAPSYHLACLFADRKRISEAQAQYRRAISIDASYRTAYQGPGYWYLQNNRLAQAERAFQNILTMDPENPHAQMGIGLIAARRKQWHRSETLLQHALSGNENLVDAHRALGSVLSKQGRPVDAIHAFERSLRLTLAGHRALLDETILSHARQGFWVDAHHADIHIRLARLYSKQGATDTAVQGYLIGIALGADGIRTRGLLAWLYLRTCRWRQALREIQKMVSLLPGTIRTAVMRSKCRVSQIIRNIWDAPSSVTGA